MKSIEESNKEFEAIKSGKDALDWLIGSIAELQADPKRQIEMGAVQGMGELISKELGLVNTIRQEFSNIRAELLASPQTDRDMKLITKLSDTISDIDFAHMGKVSRGYTTIAGTPQEVEAQVNRMMVTGWKPVGGVQLRGELTKNLMHIQTMVRDS